MLTLVAPVLAYDLAYDPLVEAKEGLEGCDVRSLRSLSRKAMSETKVEKDMTAEVL